MEPDPSRRVEAYLDQVLAPLARRLSPFQQGELRRELREHLWERIASYRQLGSSEENAVTEALKQFGGAENFLREWRQEWTKTTPQATLREIVTATRTALLLSLPVLLVACLGSPVWSQTMSRSQTDWAPVWMHACLFTSVASGWGSFGLSFVVLPLVLGAAAGKLAPRHAGVGVLTALTTLVLPADWLTMSRSLPNIGPFWVHLSFQILVCGVYWLPLACTAAALTAWWTQRNGHNGKVLA